MEKRYTVFVSSTFTDLIDARWAVAKGLMRLDMIPLGMEAFTASDLSQWEVIKETIDLSDYYILIIGNRYGTIDQETGLSYTEREYLYALEQGIPCLAFLSNDIPLYPRQIESEEHRAKLDLLRKKASAERMVDSWTNADELMGKVSAAIFGAVRKSPRPGWIRSPQAIPEVAEELARLSRKNAELEEELTRLKEKSESEALIKIEVDENGIRSVFFELNKSYQLIIPFEVKNLGRSSADNLMVTAEIEIPHFGKFSSRQSSRFGVYPGESSFGSMTFYHIHSFKEIAGYTAYMSFRVTGSNLPQPVLDLKTITIPNSFNVS